MIIGPVRVCYLSVFQPRADQRGNLKYQVTPLIPEDDSVTLQKVEDAIQAAIAKAIEKGTFARSAVPRLKLPLRNGTEEASTDPPLRGPEFKNHFFFNANNSIQPGIAAGFNGGIPRDPTELYSGCWCFLDISFFGFNTNGNAGIGAGFNNIMKYKEDARLDGRLSAEEAFADIPREDIQDDDVPF